jgi:5'-3' exonuclease
LKKLLLIDGDEFLFRAAAAVEHETKFNTVLGDVDWNEPPVHVIYSHPGRAREVLEQMLDRIFERFKTEDHFLCFSSPPNFRFAVDDTYKNNRANSRKPLCYVQLREDVEGTYKCKTFPSLEADDVMGIMSTLPKWKLAGIQPIIISQDKDMKTIPTTVWNGKDLMNVSVGEANYWHMFQTLVGDTSDGYKGCPGIGKVKAEKMLKEEIAAAEHYAGYVEAHSQDGQTPMPHADLVEDACDRMWGAVVEQFEAKGLTEADAITQARLARILRWSDWDNEKKEPILWTPPQ